MSDNKRTLNKTRQALVDRVLSRLDAGAMPWDSGLHGAIGVPFNATTNKPYRGLNALTLMLQGKSDPRWLTFNQAKEMGYAVKKGAKGVSLEHFKIIDKRTNREYDATAVKKEMESMTAEERARFKRENFYSLSKDFHVFNAEDIHGIEPFKPLPVDISARNERIERVIANSQVPIYYDGNGRNYYIPTADEIHLTGRAAFKSDEFFYNTAFHEMAHSTGHSSRLNRPGGTYGSKAYAREELVAEISSVLTAAEFGLNYSDRVIENSAEYVRSWAKDIRENPQTLIDAAFDASRATDYICDSEHRREQTQEKTQNESVMSENFAERRPPRTTVPTDFKGRVDSVLAGTYPSGELVPVGDTPKLIQDIGFAPRIMAMKQGHLRDLLKPEYRGNGGNQHGLSREFIYDIPEQIAKPAMVLRSLSNPNDSIVIVTDKVDSSNNPIIVALKADGTSGFIDGKKQTCNLVASAYGRVDFSEFIVKNCKENAVMYCDKKKSQNVFGAIRVEFPKVLGTFDSNVILQHFEPNVNSLGQKTQKENAASTPPAPPKKPYEFKTNLENIPDSMKALPNWVAFRTHEVFDEKKQEWKLKKTMLTPNQPRSVSSSDYLKWASPTDPSTWATFDKAVAFAKKYKLEGLSFAMSGSGMTCIDLDRHYDEQGNPSELAKKYIAAADNTYIEKSVSGHGLHIFYAGERPNGYQNRNIQLDLETYDSARFISMTGNYNGCDEVAPPSSELTNLLKSNLSKLQQYSAPSTPLGMDDNELIDKIRSSKRGNEFEALWRGEDVCGDHSVSDFKLCNMLAFFSGGDVSQVERCFRTSGLYRPQKGDAYVKRTAEKACATLVKTYSGVKPNNNTKKNNGRPSGSGGNSGNGSSGRGSSGR